MTEKQEKDLEIRVCIEKEDRDGPVFAFSMYGPKTESYKGLPIYGKKELEAGIALLAKHVCARIEMHGRDQVCFLYALPEPKDEETKKRWSEMEELGISRTDPKAAEVLFEMLRQHFPKAEYKK